jgi:hypothetical protein
MVSEKRSPKISDPLQKWIVPLTYPSDHDYFMNHLNEESVYANINLYFILRIVFLTHLFSHSILRLTHPLLARSTFTFGSGMWNKIKPWIETINIFQNGNVAAGQSLLLCNTLLVCRKTLPLCSFLEFSMRFGNYRLKHFMTWLNDMWIVCVKWNSLHKAVFSAGKCFS